jgi:hypothetical protein
MSNPTPQPLSPAKEAIGRAVIAEFEWKQQQQKRERRIRAWKFAMLVGWIVLLVAMAAYVRVRQIPITTYDICFWLVMMLGTGAGIQYTTHEELQKLRAEVEELKQAINRNSRG